MKKICEDNFIKALQKHNEEALVYVIKEYGPLVKSVVKKQLYNLHFCQEECINDIFLNVWDNIDKFNEERGTFKNWIIGISKYKSIDYKRKYLKNLEEVHYDSLEIKVPDNCDAAIIRAEIRNDIESLLSCLNEDDKDIFINHFINEMNPAEIAEDLGVKTSTIYNRISRGRKKIRSFKEFMRG